jgi:BirA family biotin operon repressor/biotin-[acetyl-CoA-carboxylase] ligase
MSASGARSTAAPLDAGRIRAALPPAIAARLRDGSSVRSTGSTNADLLARPALPPGRFDFLTSEYQSAGRGRRARRWLAPRHGAVCLSVSWRCGRLPDHIGALSLAVGVCVVRALSRLGVLNVGLKWPNDVVSGDAKLGGILCELSADVQGPGFLVIGIGLNAALDAETIAQIAATGTRATDLTAIARIVPDRSELAASLISETVAGLIIFEQDGFAPFVPEWRAADVLAGKPVRVSLDGATATGHARGIDLDGALCLQTADGLQRFVNGEATVRAEE